MLDRGEIIAGLSRIPRLLVHRRTSCELAVILGMGDIPLELIYDFERILKATGLESKWTFRADRERVKIWCIPALERARIAARKLKKPRPVKLKPRKKRVHKVKLTPRMKRGTWLPAPRKA